MFLVNVFKGVVWIGRASPVGEVKYILKQIDGVGKSKREQKRENSGKTKYIHSFEYKKEVHKESVKFSKWLRNEQGKKTLFQCTSQDYQKYIEIRAAKVSPQQVVNIESYLGKLQQGMAEVSHSRGKEPVIFAKRIYEPKKCKVEARNRSYVREELQKIYKNSSKNFKNAINLSRATGVRASEAVLIRAGYFYEDRKGNMYLQIPSTKEGITKGNRPRTAQVLPEYQKTIKGLIEGKKPEERVLDIKTTSGLRSSLSNACKKADIKAKSEGMHGFRHMYARELLEQKIENREKSVDIRDAVKQIQFNKEQGLRVDNGFSREEKEYLREAKACINEVHENLGHGEDRWALFMTYMAK